jgi:hypothetical protein
MRIKGKATPRSLRQAFEPVMRPVLVIHRKDRLARPHEGSLEQEHHDCDGDKELHQGEELALRLGIEAEREREGQKATEHHVGVGEERRHDDGSGDCELRHRIEPVEERLARYIIDHINHAGPSPR